MLKQRESVAQPLDKPYRFIALTQSQVAIVDVEDFEYLNQWKWHAAWNDHVGGFYAKRRDGNRTLFMHRAILESPKGKEVDHRNHNTLDNRRENLRKSTRGENARNYSITPGRSGYKGVHLGKRGKKWLAFIRYGGKKHYVGSFPTPLKAAKAYDEAARTHHGEFANTNF